jgi:drug/metabolite transporter (DMT)-like permease
MPICSAISTTRSWNPPDSMPHARRDVARWQLPRLGSAWMVVGGLLFALMGVFVKLGSGHFSSSELVFYRSLVGVSSMLALARVRKLPTYSPHWRVHVVRSLAGLAGMLLLFHVIGVLPLSTAVTLNYTSPLFLVVLGALVLRERPRRLLVVAVVLGFVGVVVLLRPTLAANQTIAGLLGLASGLCAGIAFLTTSQLGRAGEPAWRIVLYFMGVATVGSGAIALVQGFHPIGWDGWWILVGLGISATFGQLAMTRAYNEGETLTVGSLGYSTVVFTALLSILIWSEEVPATSWLAIALIAFSGILAAKLTSGRVPAAGA